MSGGRCFVSSFFAQDWQGCEELEKIDQHGVESWLESIASALDLRDGETTESPPWGRADSLLFEERDPEGETIRVHANFALGYVGITLETES